MRFAYKHLVQANTLSASFNSDSLVLDSMIFMGIEAVITTADANGVFKLQISIDGSTWIDYPSSSQTLAGANLNIMWDVSDLSSRYARVVYTRASGGGAGTVCDIYVFLKGNNAS